MAKKKAVIQKPDSEPEATKTAGDDSAAVTPSASVKSKSRPGDDQSTDGGIGISDIKKAVAFSPSVGGLEKAVALLQILKVAKDVQ